MPNNDNKEMPEKIGTDLFDKHDVNDDRNNAPEFEIMNEYGERLKSKDIQESSRTLDDIENTGISVEENFAKRIESISLDELKAERERLIELGALDGDEIARRYAEFMEEQ